jgi:RNA polymerase sigma factor (sigma-70 family)
MTTTQTGVVLRHIRGLRNAGAAHRLSDRQLLERYAARHEEAAFEALLKRHGPMVQGVCRRVLGGAHDAEDAFQATFLVLARQAGAIGRRESVGGWLYRVAYNTALKAKASAAARRRREQRPDERPATDPLADVTGRELLTALDEELQRLPEKYRAALVLCYLEGLTRDEAAGRLGVSESTLKRRLEEGRERLRLRLERRGLALSAALLAAGVGGLAVSPSLAAATAGAARLVAAGNAGAVPARVAGLMAEALRAVTAGPRRIIGALLVAATVVATGVALSAYRPPAAAGDDPPRAAEAPKPAAAAGDEEMIVTGRVLGADGQPLPGAAVVVVGLPQRAYRGGDPAAYRGTLLAEGKADADGKFRLPAPRTSSANYREVYAVAAAEKHAPAWRRLNPDAEQPEAALTLPAEQIVRGSLVDLQGLPAAGVKVTVTYIGGMVNGQPDGVALGNLPKHSPWPESVTTDEKGAFVIRGCNRDQGLTLTASDDRFATQSFQVDTPGKPRPESRVLGYDAGGFLHEQVSGPNEKGQPEVLKLPLTPGRLVEGRVTYADTGKPAAGAWVGGTRADEDGRFRLRFAGRGGVTLEVFAPEGEPYLSVWHRVEFPKGSVKQEAAIALPRGVLVRGKVTEAGSGNPVAGAAVQFWPRDVGDPNRPKNVFTGWYHVELTKADGTFRMAVLPGESHLLIQGPTPDYIHEEIGSEVIRVGRAGGGRTYPDAFVKLDVPAKGEPKEVAVTLRRGATVRGKLLGSDGKPVKKALMAHRLHVSIALGWQFPEEVRDGVFEVHGLDPEKGVPVYFLDAENQCGATVILSGKQAGETVTVKLAPCGKATARYLDGQGRPLADYAASPDLVITPGAAGRVIVPGKEELLADATSLTNFDRHNYWARLKTDEKGRITFPALIPGATYRVERWEKDGWVPHKEFTAESGKTIDLGDVPIDRKE